uniref:FkbM family methyltransferase n=1 Tax=Eubacterium plexicaudatum ASF492 TaxID=1235802 RepID=N2B629_9FIRM
MKKIDKNNIPKEIINDSIYLYGAGYTAKICIKALESESVKIESLIDDDLMKHGTKELSYDVLSYNEFAEICKSKKSINVVLTSIYGKTIYDKLMVFSNVTIWEMYDWYMDVLDQQELVVEKHCEGERLVRYKRNTDALKKYLSDDLSKSVYDAVYQYYITNDINEIVKVCTTEESYFIKEVKEYFQGRKFTLVDAGAYTGELLRAIIESGLWVSKWYCFEAEKNNYEKLLNNIEKSVLPEGMKCLCENYGLWSEQKELPVMGQGASSKVVEDAELCTGEVCKMETIDTYFQNIKVDMIKMDIEGAEMRALGGAVNTIKRDMPLLAISIYHCVEDYYRIMQFIMKIQGRGYKYYIRQHAMIYGETILYAIPRIVENEYNNK